MSAPLKKDTPTGKPRGLAIVLLLFLIVGGCLLYAANRPALPMPQKNDTPQVEGVSSDQPSVTDEEIVPQADTPEPEAPAADIPMVTYEVTTAVDGDTIKASVDGKTETIRLIGVDTPETKDPRKKVQCFGAQASEFTKKSLLGKRVRLVADKTQDNRDKYGRLLRYVFLTDGTNFNGKLIRDGYAYEYTYKVVYIYQTDFKAFQADATAGQKGLWAPTTCAGIR